MLSLSLHNKPQSLRGIVATSDADASVPILAADLYRKEYDEEDPSTPSMSATTTSSSSSSSSSSSTLASTRMDKSTTLDDIQQRGVLNCGVVVAPGFVEQPSPDTFAGIDVDLCRAVAAGIFGVAEEDPDKYIDYNIMTYAERWEALESKEVDLLAASTTHTMERDVFIPKVGTGFSFSTPYYYFFHAFAGVQNMVACADNMDVSGLVHLSW